MSGQGTRASSKLKICFKVIGATGSHQKRDPVILPRGGLTRWDLLLCERTKRLRPTAGGVSVSAGKADQ